MALVLADRVKDTTLTAGTGAVTLSGTAPSGFRSFGAGVGDGNTTYYTIAGVGTSEWEVGIGTYTAAGTSLSRDVVLASSNGNALVPFSAGAKDVFVTYTAAKSVNYDASGNVNINITGQAALATNLYDGTANAIPYQSAANTTTFLSSASGVLYSTGGAPSWSQTPTLTSVALTSGTVSSSPTNATDLVNKTYVDTIAAIGLHYHQPVKYEVPDTTGNLNAIYNQPGGPGVGVGATLTNNGTLAAFAPDGPTAQVGDRILIYNQTNAFENGVYEVTTVGDGSTAWVLTRTSDTDTFASGPTGLGEGSAFYITSGNTGAGETYEMNVPGTITFGTTAITFVQITSAQVYSAGTGLTLTGTTFSLTAPVATTLGGTGLSSFTANGAVYATSTSALTTGTLPVASGGTGQTSFTDGELLIGVTAGNTLAKGTLTAGTGVSISNGAGAITVTNTAPDQVVALTAGTNVNITGTYPNFTIEALGGGTVSSVSGSGSVNGITLSGTVTSTGSLTLGGTLSGVSLTTQVTGTLPIANGGTNGTASPVAGAVAYGTGTAYAFSAAGTAGQVLLSNGTSAPSFGGIDGGTF